MPRTPPEINRHILKLVRQLDPAGTPLYVPVAPGEGCVPGRFYENVPRVVRTHGGAVQYGWNLREQPGAFVEGQFHAVWRQADGQFLDVTPGSEPQEQILFLPDSKLVWEGEPVDSRRNMLHEMPCYCGSGMPFNICHGLDDD